MRDFNRVNNWAFRGKNMLSNTVNFPPKSQTIYTHRIHIYIELFAYNYLQNDIGVFAGVHQAVSLRLTRIVRRVHL